MTAVEIMIVDDSKEWRLQVRRFLEPLPGFRVIAEAANGLEAVENAARLPPDIVLLDIAMPLLNGIEAARRIREASPESGIVFLTEDSSSDVREECFRAGAAGYVLKSNAVHDLLLAINAALTKNGGFQFHAAYPETLSKTIPSRHSGAEGESRTIRLSHIQNLLTRVFSDRNTYPNPGSHLGRRHDFNQSVH